MNSSSCATVAGAMLLALARPSGSLAAPTSRAHVHGAARLNVAVDGTSVLIGLEIPGNDIFGFEHPPRTDGEKKAVKDALATLRTKSGELFVLPKEAACQAGEIKVSSIQESPNGDAGEVIETPKHADVDGDFAFKCKSSPIGGTLRLAIFKAFPRIKSIRVQVISGATQSGLTAHGEQDIVRL